MHRHPAGNLTKEPRKSRASCRTQARSPIRRIRLIFLSDIDTGVCLKLGGSKGSMELSTGLLALSSDMGAVTTRGQNTFLRSRHHISWLLHCCRDIQRLYSDGKHVRW